MNKTGVHPAAEENVGFLLWRVSTLWSSSTETVLKPFGLTHPQFVLLATMDLMKEATPEKIGKRVVLDPKITSHLLRSLQVKGMIVSENNTYQLTTAGKELLAKVLPVIEKADAAFFASIENSKMVTALQMLARANL